MLNTMKTIPLSVLSRDKPSAKFRKGKTAHKTVKKGQTDRETNMQRGTKTHRQTSIKTHTQTGTKLPR